MLRYALIMTLQTSQFFGQLPFPPTDTVIRMAQSRRNVVVIGLGTFGTAVARELTRMGDRVLGVDVNEAEVASIADEIDSALVADAADIKAVREIGLEAYDAVIISIGENMQSSILAAMNILEAGCTDVWVKAQSDTHKTILERIGIQNVVLPEANEGLHLAQLVHNPRMRNYLCLWDEVFLAEIRVPSRFSTRGFSPQRLKDKYALTCLGVIRDKQVFPIEDGEQNLGEDDRLILFGNRADIRRFADGSDA
tara:strand:- start:3208 stop:3963 length:756 start_codon:yes stop_codon:yes gene_type:complete